MPWISRGNLRNRWKVRVSLSREDGLVFELALFMEDLDLGRIVGELDVANAQDCEGHCPQARAGGASPDSKRPLGREVQSPESLHTSSRRDCSFKIQTSTQILQENINYFRPFYGAQNCSLSTIARPTLAQQATFR